MLNLYHPLCFVYVKDAFKIMVLQLKKSQYGSQFSFWTLVLSLNCYIAILIAVLYPRYFFGLHSRWQDYFIISPSLQFWMNAPVLLVLM